MTAEHAIMIVDDDQEIRDLLGDFLGGHGFEVIAAANGTEMFEQLAQSMPDLIVLDVMMPGEDGFSLCRKVRADSTLPIIMLTAVSDETDRIVGLEIGADDYLAKPFNPRELLARIKAILRRSTDVPVSEDDGAPEIYHFAGWCLDTGKRRLTSSDNVEVPLSAGEYDLLLVLVQKAQRVLSRDQLLELTKNRTAGPFDRSVDVQVSRLRQKIEEDAKSPQLIKTVRGGGYMLAIAASKE